MSAPDKCSCKEAFERLDAFLLRDLTPEEVKRVDAHLCECIECAEAFKLEEKVLECVKRKVSQIALPQDLLDRVKAALDECEK